LKEIRYPGAADRKRQTAGKETRRPRARVRRSSERATTVSTEGRWLMPLLWLLVILLVIFAIVGGVAINNFLWLVLIIALVVAVLAML
jgi:hypothetical protein